MNITANPVARTNPVYSPRPNTAMDFMKDQPSNTAATNKGCKACHARLIELKKQTIKIMKSEYQRMIAENTTPTLDSLLNGVYKNLKLPEHHLNGTANQSCVSCGLHIDYLKRYSLLSLQTASFTPFLSSQRINMSRSYNEQKVDQEPKGIATRGETTDSLAAYTKDMNHTDISRETNEERNSSSMCASPAAAHFFTEAARKFNIPNKKKSISRNTPLVASKSVEDDSIFPTNFSGVLRSDPPSNPPGLFKYGGRRVDGKVSVILRITPDEAIEQTDSFIEVDQRRKQISVLPPKNLNILPQKMQHANSNAPKLYAFDSIFESEMTQNRVSSTSLLDVLHAVINGGEGCLLTYGASSVGKTSTMVGTSNTNKTLGAIPSAISWMYSLIKNCKQQTGARISVRVSAVEIVGPTENLKDLLSEQASGGDSTDSSGVSPGIYLSEDPVGGTVQLGNVSEPQAVSAEKAAFYLDAALNARTTETDEFGEKQNSHMIYTMHIYKYIVDKSYKSRNAGAVPYSGGRSRLHLIDLSHVNQKFARMQNGVTPSHAGLGQIIVALLNGFKQLPYRNSKITRLLKDSIGNPTCRTTLIAHVSAQEKNYSKTCSTIQMISKIHKSRRKRNKYCSSSSDNSNSCDESRRRGPHAPLVKTYGIDDSYMSSDCNTSSAGEESCDTVIYMGANGHLSDRDLSDNERPPSPNTINKIKLKLASSSEDESNEVRLTIAGIEKKQNFDFNIPSNNTETNFESKKLNDQTTGNKSSEAVDVQPVEKAVNVVAPLVIKAANVTTRNVDETAEPNQFEKAADQGFDIDFLEEKAPSEKQLRRREKRIAKLLKSDIMNISNRSSKKRDGYMSDVSKPMRDHQKFDGYISAPENYRSKPIQIVRGTVRQPTISEQIVRGTVRQPTISEHEPIPSSPKDILSNLTKRLNQRIATVEKKFLFNETCLDDVCKFDKLNDHHGVTANMGTSVDEPKDDINELLDIGSKNSDMPIPDIYSDLKLTTLSDTCKFLETHKCSAGSNSVANLLQVSEQLDSKSVIRNLDHVITVSSVPNFSVTERPLNTYLGSPQLRSRNEIKTGDELIEFKAPHFERSYSREDTASLMSVNESDAYDSDNYSICSASPSIPTKNRRPTRLKYRWSTVFEEDENKKENKIDKSNTKKPETIYNTLNSVKSPKLNKKLESKSPKVNKRFQLFSTSKPENVCSPKVNRKFSLLSPKSERKAIPVPAADKRMSHCSDTSSGIGSNSSNSQSSSLQSGEKIKIDYSQSTEKESKYRLWPFSRRSRKARSHSAGYVSDGIITDSTRLSRKAKLFGSKSKSSIYTDGHSSGYDTSITEYGVTSCAEDLTDTESGSFVKKKKRFLNFRRRSTNDLASSRGRVKKPIWFDSRRCQSDDEGLQIKVYQIDEPGQMSRSQSRQEGVMSPNTRSRRLEELKKHREHLKSELHLALDKFPMLESNAQLAKINLHNGCTSLHGTNNSNPLNASRPLDRISTLQVADELEKGNQSMNKKIKAIKSQIQVVTCFDTQVRKTTQI